MAEAKKLEELGQEIKEKMNMHEFDVKVTKTDESSEKNKWILSGWTYVIWYPTGYRLGDDEEEELNEIFIEDFSWGQSGKNNQEIWLR